MKSDAREPKLRGNRQSATRAGKVTRQNRCWNCYSSISAKAEISKRKLSIPSRGGGGSAGSNKNSRMRGKLNAPFLHTPHYASTLDSLWPRKIFENLRSDRNPPFFSCETSPPFFLLPFATLAPLWPPLFPLCLLPNASRAESARTTRQLLLKDRYNLGNNPAAL